MLSLVLLGFARLGRPLKSRHPVPCVRDGFSSYAYEKLSTIFVECTQPKDALPWHYKLDGSAHTMASVDKILFTYGLWFYELLCHCSATIRMN